MNSAASLRTAGRILGGLALLFLFANLVTFGYGRDQGIYAAVGDAIVHGGAPYKDAWDFKPPGIYFIYAATQWLLGSSPVAIRVVETAAWCTVPFALSRFARGRSSLGDAEKNAFIGFLGGVFGVYLHVFKDFWHTAQPESFGAVCLVWALVLTRPPNALPTQKRLALRWLGAAALCSFAGLLKPPLYGPLPLLLALHMAERHRSPVTELGRNDVAVTVAAILGTAIPVVGTLAYFVAKGALGDLVATLFGFAPLYTKLDFSAHRLPEYVAQAFTDITFRWSPLLAVWPLAFTPFLPKSVRTAIDSRALAAFIVPTLVGVAVQGKFFPYHYDAAVPFVALAATAVMASVVDRLSAWRVPPLILASACVATVGFALRTPPDIYSIAHFWDRVPWRIRAASNASQRDAIFDAITSEGDVLASENRALSQWLRDHTAEHEPFFIWGFEPVVYLTSGRPRATRYLYNVPQRLAASREAACRTLVADLTATPPKAVVIERDDRFPWVTGTNADSMESVGDCPEWESLLDGFTETWRSQKFIVLQKPSAKL